MIRDLDYIHGFACFCCDPVPKLIPDLPVTNKKRRPRVTGIKADPSRTLGLQRRFIVELNRRFRQLARDIQTLIVEEDAFGLKTNKLLTTLAEQRRWQFLTDDQKVRAFKIWLQGEVDRGILAVPDGQNAWTATYIQSAYKKGFTRAYDDTNRLDMIDPDLFTLGGRAQFLHSAFGGPETIKKLQLLGTRTYTQLQGVTDTMSATMSRVLVSGLAEGVNVGVISRRLMDQVGFAATRAHRVARTEIMFAHGEGQLDSFEALGVEELNLLAEWSTAGDGRVCPVCAPLEGLVLTIKEARGMLPRHPQCRCTWIPANVTENEAKQKRTKARITDAVRKSLERETGRKGKEAKERSRWVGADKVIKPKQSQR